MMSAPYPIHARRRLLAADFCMPIYDSFCTRHHRSPKSSTNADHDDIDTISHSTIGVNLEIVLEIDHDDLYADITSVP